MGLPVAATDDSPHNQSIRGLTKHSNADLGIVLDAMGSEVSIPQISWEDITHDDYHDDSPHDRLYLEVIANSDAGVVEELIRHETRLVALRKKLDGHWADDECRHCPSCAQKKTYTHGVFTGTSPITSPDPISVQEARSRAEPSSRRIWQDYAHLKAVVERYEAVIQKRWAKKTTSKRKLALQSAWAATSNRPPQPLADMHRPDVYYLRNRCRGKKICCAGEPVEEDKRHLFFWPRLNLEDLTKFEPLLLLLNARGRHPPPTFALADLEPVHFGLRVDRLSHPPYLDMHNMLFTGQDGPELYGQLVSWEQDPEAYHRLHMGRDTSPGEGLWILEIQERLYKFLVNMCQAILHDQYLDDHARLLAQPVAPEPPLPTANGQGTDTGTSLMITRNEGAYHVPAKLDIRRLQNLIESKLAEAEDTLWALREDPSFFATALMETFQSRPEQLRDTANRRHPSIDKSDARDKFVACIVGVVWRQHVSAVERWGLLCRKVSHLANLKERLFDNAKVPIRPEDDLPPELAMAIYDLLFHLHNHLAGRLGYVLAQAQCSPPLRHLYRRKLCFKSDLSHDKSLEEDVLLVSSGVLPSPEISDFLWVLRRMSQPDSCRSFGLHNCVEEIERIARDRAGFKIISKTQAADLSDYTIVSECIRQLELFQPWAATFDAGMADSETAQELNFQYAATAYAQNALFLWTPSDSTCALGATLAQVPYPVEKAPSKGNTDAMRKAEGLLDAFWEAALLEFKDSKLITEGLSKVLLGDKPERTPLWVEPPEAEAKAMPDNEKGSLPRPFDGGPGHVHTSPTRVNIRKPRIKVKSRGVARTTTSEPEEAAKHTQVPQPPTLLSIDVDRRAWKVLEMLFYKTSPGSSQGEIPWTDFTYTMHHVGFGVEKLGGSSWQFTPGSSLLTERGYTRGIQFHEPHPRAKLAFVVARQYGRRLARTYGWCAEMFRLRTA